jgi:hypothetical protein
VHHQERAEEQTRDRHYELASECTGKRFSKPIHLYLLKVKLISFLILKGTCAPYIKQSKYRILNKSK